MAETLTVYHNDPVLDIHYDRKNNTTLNPRNAVGPTSSLTLLTIDYSPTDTNTVYVSKSGSDTTGNGNKSTPYLTPQKAVDSVTSARGRIMFTDSNEYAIVGQTLPANCIGLYADLGCTPTLTFIAGSIAYKRQPNKSVVSWVEDGATSYRKYDRWWNFIALKWFDGSRYDIYNYGGALLNTITPIQPNIIGVVDNYFCHYGFDTNYIYIQRFNSDLEVINTEIEISSYSFTNISYIGKRGDIIIFRGYKATEHIIEFNTITAITEIYPVSEFNGMEFKYWEKYNCFVCYSAAVGIGLFSYSNRSMIRNKSLASCNYIIVNSNSIAAGYGSSGNIYDYDLNIKSAITANTVINSRYFLIGATTVWDDVLFATFTIENGNGSNLSRKIISGDPDEKLDNALIIAIINSSTGYTQYYHYTNCVLIGVSGSYQYNAVGNCYQIYNVNIPYYITSVGGMSAWIQNGEMYVSYYGGIRYDNPSYTNGAAVSVHDIPYSWQCLKPSAPLTISGISIKPLYSDHCDSCIESTFNLIFDHSKIEGIVCDYLNESIIPAAIKSSSTCNVIIQNSIIKKCGNGVIKSGSGNVTVNQSQIYMISRGNGLDISNAVAGNVISITHSDILFCVTGIKLRTNTGATVTISASILHKHILYAVDSDLSVTLKNSVYNGPLRNCSLSDSYLADPYYIASSSTDVDNMDLHLQTKQAGYNTDSLAVGIEVNTGKNAGSYDIEIMDVADSWTVARFLKQEIDITYVPIGAYKQQNTDGSISARKKGQSKEVRLRFKAQLNPEFDNLLKILTRNTNFGVRVYFDPITNPTLYEYFTVDPTQSIKGSPSLYKLSRTGVEGPELVLIRAYEVA